MSEHHGVRLPSYLSENQRLYMLRALLEIPGALHLNIVIEL